MPGPLRWRASLAVTHATGLRIAATVLHPTKTRVELVEGLNTNGRDNRVPPQKGFLYRDLRQPDHCIPRHKLRKFRFAHILGPYRALRQDQVTHLSTAIPHADLYRLV